MEREGTKREHDLLRLLVVVVGIAAAYRHGWAAFGVYGSGLVFGRHLGRHQLTEEMRPIIALLKACARRGPELPSATSNLKASIRAGGPVTIAVGQRLP